MGNFVTSYNFLKVFSSVWGGQWQKRKTVTNGWAVPNNKANSSEEITKLEFNFYFMLKSISLADENFPF